MPLLELSIAGMSCEGCSSRIKRMLEARPDVRSANIDHDRGHGLIEMVESGDTNAIVQAVNDTGFSCTI